MQVSEIEIEKAEDVQILERARIEKRFESRWTTTSIRIWQRLDTGSLRWCLRVQGLDAQGKADLSVRYCSSAKKAFSEGAAVSANCETSRIRRLPLQ